MTLSELAFACFCYSRFTDYDNSYLDFLKATNSCPNLSLPGHRKSLLVWLNQWGCRQFALEYHSRASKELHTWNVDYLSSLGSSMTYLWEMNDDSFGQIAEAYDSLLGRIASIRHLNGKKQLVTFGPTGVAKILFAVHPNTFIPWDEPIRRSLNYEGSSKSYIHFLRNAKDTIKQLDGYCLEHGFPITQLPQMLDRPNSSVPKLIDEYYWTTITKRWDIPNSYILEKWAKWSRKGREA